jgi:hypothetical protein
MAGVKLGEVGVADEQRDGGVHGADVAALGEGRHCPTPLPWPLMERSRGGNEVAAVDWGEEQGSADGCSIYRRWLGSSWSA